MSKSRVWMVAVAAVVGCGQVRDVEVQDTKARIITISDADSCNAGQGPSKCVTVTPLLDLTRYQLDGEQLSPDEYWGFKGLEYWHIDPPASGQVYVGADAALGRLAVALDDVPVVSNQREVTVYLDFDRFAPGGEAPRPEDRAYRVDLNTQAVDVLEGDGTGWVPSFDQIPMLRVGNCGSTIHPEIVRCSLEMLIDIAPAALAAAPEAQRGLGLAVSNLPMLNGMPDELIFDQADLTVDRTFYQTVLFSEPSELEFSLMTWNLHRWTSQDATLLPGESHDLRGKRFIETAFTMARADVVAVQELWEDAQANRLRDLIQLIRASVWGDPSDLYVIKGGDFEPGFLNIGPEDVLLDETHSGLYVFSKFPVISDGFHQYDKCRGEDCLKAKGIQHARIWIGAHSPENTDPNCLNHAHDQPGSNCPPLPSGGNYFDLFNTHLQANPDLCDPVLYAALHAAITAAVGPNPFYNALLEAQFYCVLRSTEGVRADQLAEARDFIDDVLHKGQAPKSPKRQVLIVGDFNINGDYEGPPPPANPTPPTGEYETIFPALGIAAAGAGPLNDWPNDVIHPYPDDFAWDVDHGDLIRQFVRADPTQVQLLRATTYKTSRYDYILVRNHIAFEGVNDFVFSRAKPDFFNVVDDGERVFVTTVPAERDKNGNGRDDLMETAELLGFCPWAYRDVLSQDCGIAPPGFPTCATAGNWDCNCSFEQFYSVAGNLGIRCTSADFQQPWATPQGESDDMSDHEPVTAHLRLVRFDEPKKYRHNVPHTGSFKVQSVDATGHDDCFVGVCGSQELYTHLTLHKKLVGAGSYTDVTGFDTNWCEGNTAQGSCVNGWGVGLYHTPGVEAEHVFKAWLREFDDSSGNDEYPTMAPGSHPRMAFFWNTGVLQVRSVYDAQLKPNSWPEDLPVFDNDGIQWCTRQTADKMCVAFDMNENLP